MIGIGEEVRREAMQDATLQQPQVSPRLQSASPCMKHCPRSCVHRLILELDRKLRVECSWGYHRRIEGQNPFVHILFESVSFQLLMWFSRIYLRCVKSLPLYNLSRTYLIVLLHGFPIIWLTCSSDTRTAQKTPGAAAVHSWMSVRTFRRALL